MYNSSSSSSESEDWLYDLIGINSSSSSEDISVVFDKKKIVAGISKIDGKELIVKLVATITPIDDASEISFSSSDTDRAKVAETGRTTEDGSVKVSLDVSGVSPTPVDAPSGDASIQAKKGNKVLTSIKVVVVVPKTQSHSVGTPTFQNFHTDGPLGTVTLSSKGDALVTISIFDQFNKALSPIYNADNVVTEEFEIQSQPVTVFPVGVHKITTPNASLVAGKKGDQVEVSFNCPFNTSYTEANGTSWDAYGFSVSGFDNAFGVYLSADTTCIAIQKIKAWGYALTPNFKRTIVLKKANHSPIPFSVSDEAQ
jgi:hypothetical protein